MELRLPAPCIVVLIGPSGSGKSTWAEENFDQREIVSSDRLRSVVGTGEDDQAAGTVAFELVDRIVSERARRRLTTVIDTTGLDQGNRARWVGIAHRASLPVYAIVFDTPGDVCEERNASRARPIPRAALRKQVSRFRSAVDEIAGEPFDGIHRPQPATTVTPAMVDLAASVTDPPATGHSFGLQVSRFDWPAGEMAERMVSIAQRAEAAGFRDVWVMDHFRQIPQVGRAWEDMPEAYATLAFLAGHTTTLRLGALVSPITHRHPVVLGKMIATLDVLSGGRANCGLGIGWDREEHRAYGLEFPPVPARYAMLEDTLEMLPLLWGKGSPSFEGKTFSAQQLICYPRPVQEHIPILIGGSGERQTLRLVAERADACNLFGTPEMVRRKVDALWRHCETLGRDPATVEVSHLVTVLTAEDRKVLRARVDSLRGRTTTSESFAARNNAGTVEDHIGLFSSYARSGVNHSIVALPDVAMEGSIESFGRVIQALGRA